MRRSLALLLGTLVLTAGSAYGADPSHIQRLLEHRRCSGCRLMDADLVHADLRDADLSRAALQRANLSQVNLDGADLRDADLSFTTLQGASLRGADLRGSRLYGTDLRRVDLSGAQLDPGALEESHWQGAKGINAGVRSHASLHNAGVDAAQEDRWADAERLFSQAIQDKPEEPLSWVARGLSRGELGRFDDAARDLAYAGRLFEQEGDQVKAEQLKAASERVTQENGGNTADEQGNGVGSALLGGTLSAIQSLAPIALRALMPLMP